MGAGKVTRVRTFSRGRTVVAYPKGEPPQTLELSMRQWALLHYCLGKLETRGVFSSENVRQEKGGGWAYVRQIGRGGAYV